jgi:hypothetical protein
MAEKGARPAVAQFVERQGRFRKMSPGQLQLFQKSVDQKWNEYLRRAAE